MLPLSCRLRKTKEIERVFHEGRGFKEDSLLLKMARNGLKTSRFGFVVSQKSVKKATQRNKVKRRLREIIKDCFPGLKQGFDVILLALSGAGGKNFKELQDSTKKLLKKSGLI